MMTAIAFEFFYFFEGIYFCRLNLECFILVYIANITFKQFTKWWIYDFIKKWANKEQYDKKAEGNQNSASIIVSVDGKGTVFLVKLKLQGESFE